MTKKRLLGFLFIACFISEAFFAHVFYREIIPFPVEEYWFTVLNGFLRDAALIGAGLLLYIVRKRVRDRVHRYFPVVVIGVLYLLFAFFMVSYVKLDWGFLTVLAVFAGLNNNLVLCLLAAMFYHKQPGWFMKLFYFSIYFLTGVLMILDAVYFWNTSMHIESVLFRNLNYYSVKGVLETSGPVFPLVIAAVVLVIVLLFRVSKPTAKKPNFTWSIFGVAAFTLFLNFTYLGLSGLSQMAISNFGGLWSEVEIEKIRQDYRNVVAMPVNVNFFSKAFFDTDRVVTGVPLDKKRELTDKDKEVLVSMGINPDKTFTAPPPAAYDRVIILMLESVHRDFFHYYNPEVPAEATPFIDYLLANYPHLNYYYSSALPTTEGINAAVRSRLLFDRDRKGKDTGNSLYRQLPAGGWRGIFMNASSGYYSNEFKEYPNSFGMQEYYAREYLEDRGYNGASGWGFHNDVMYKETLAILARHHDEKMFMITKTLDMHQPYPYYGFSWDEMPPAVRDHEFVTVRGIYWVNKTLEQFFRTAEANGLMDDRTLFVITSDHNPHSGGEYKSLVKNQADTQSIAPIPLIFVSKNLKPLAGLKENDYASSIDLATTLLPLMGLPTPPDFIGRDLLKPTSIPFALGYFGGKAYYFSDNLTFVDVLDNPYPGTAEEDALANFIVWDYARHF